MEAALLAEHFHLYPDRLKRLTPRYIQKVLKHHRDRKSGRLRFRHIVKPDEPTTRESQHRNLEYLAAVLGASLTEFAVGERRTSSLEEAQKAIDEKWDKLEGKNPDGNTGSGSGSD